MAHGWTNLLVPLKMKGSDSILANEIPVEMTDSFPDMSNDILLCDYSSTFSNYLPDKQRKH